MNVDNIKMGLRDFAYFGGIVVTIMVNYFSLRADINTLAKTTEGEKHLYELRIQLLETGLAKLNADVERMRYQNLDDVNTKPRNRR